MTVSVTVTVVRRVTSRRMAATRAGISAQPFTRRNERSASSIPAATQRFFMEPSFQRFTRPMTVRATEIIDSMQLVLVSVSASRPPTPRRRTVNMSSRPSSRLAAASG